MAGFPEEAIVDASIYNPLDAARLIMLFSKREQAPIAESVLVDLARNANISNNNFQKLLSSFLEIGLIHKQGEKEYVLKVSSVEAAQHAAVLRGVGYANFRHRDSNNVEITLSPPAYPSRLMEELPKQGFSWAKLYDTKDSLIELASKAEKRFVIVSPFLDTEGAKWITQLFGATEGKPVERVLIIRGKEQKAIDVINDCKAKFSESNIKVFTYAISHEREQRNLEIETFHAKILLADHDKAYIGSANMTQASRDFSMECGTIIKGPCVKPVSTLIETIIKISDRWL